MVEDLAVGVVRSDAKDRASRPAVRGTDSAKCAGNDGRLFQSDHDLRLRDREPVGILAVVVVRRRRAVPERENGSLIIGCRSALGLFLGGVALCQFAVLPRSIEAAHLLWFNEWLGIAPDLRLNEWLSFAIWLPVIFGVAFQTPLVMMVLERIGIMTVQSYLKLWRIAIFVLAVFAAVITPTTDFVTWFALWAPMVGLYFLGIYLCWIAARRRPTDFDVPGSDELVEV